MNWKNIKKKYPKSIEKLFDWLEIEEWGSESNPKWGTKWYQFENDFLFVHEGFAWHYRSLYSFFDAQDIAFNGGFYFGENGAGYNFTVIWKIVTDYGFLHEDKKLYNTLIEAETAAFKIAFKLLEENLTR